MKGNSLKSKRIKEMTRVLANIRPLERQNIGTYTKADRYNFGHKLQPNFTTKTNSYVYTDFNFSFELLVYGHWC